MKCQNLKLLNILVFLFIWMFAEANAENEKILQRDEVDQKYKWDLTHIYTSDQAWERDYNLAVKELEGYKHFRGLLSHSSKDLLAYLKFDEQISKRVGLLSLYAKLSRDLDIINGKNNERWNKIELLKSSIEESKAYFYPELLLIPVEKLNSFIENDSELKPYKHFLFRILKSADHILNENEERILSLVTPLSNMPTEMFFTIKAEIKPPLICNENQDSVLLTDLVWEASKISFNRNYRQRAYTQFFYPYMDQKNTYATLLNSRLKAQVFNAQIRNYSSAMEASLKPNNIPVSVYNTLIKSVNENLTPLQRWIDLKKTTLELDTFYDYDSHVSIFPENLQKYTYEEAKALIFEALKPLGEKYIQDLKMAFDNRWVDVYYTKGKATGGYSSGVTPGTHPYVLINWTGTVADLMELTHEMGHCMHAYYTGLTQPYVYADYSYFAGEVASTTNEALLTRYLINNAKSNDEKAMHIEKSLNNMKLMFYWTTMMAEFEKIIYDKVESGHELQASTLCNIVEKLSKKYYGSSMTTTHEETYIWGPLRHLYIVDFYLYQYAVGFAASQEIVSKILSDPESSENYLNFLKAGNSIYPIDAIKKAGVDLNSNRAVESVAKEMNSLLDQFETLTQ